MALVWRVCAVCVVVVGVAAGDRRSGDRWVWGRSGSNRKASSIPDFVQPHLAVTTPPPPITTFRPSLQGLGRGAPPRHFPRVSAHPFFLGPFSPFSLIPISPPRPASDGTTKSRVPIDTAFDGASGAVLDAGDKYTTLDRLQQERGTPPPLPKPKKHQLGGLHPDEVFYADDDLLIIKGGGFNSDAFEEPSQTLDGDDDDVREGSPTNLSPVVAPLPSPHHEYNGNIPAIVPPPHHMTDLPFSLFVESASANDYILVPHVMPHSGATVLPAPGTFTNRLDGDKSFTRRRVSAPYLYSPPARTTSFLTWPAKSRVVLGHRTPAHRVVMPIHNTFQSPHNTFQSPHNTFQSPHNTFQSPHNTFQSPHNTFQSPHNTFQSHPNTLQLPHSLAGDTDVNFLQPRPPVNPMAEVFLPRRTPEKFVPGWTRQQGRPHL